MIIIKPKKKGLTGVYQLSENTNNLESNIKDISALMVVQCWLNSTSVDIM